jgi:hypothetical protein
MRKKLLRWIFSTGLVALLLAVVNGCGEKSLPPTPTGAVTQVTISGGAV